MTTTFVNPTLWLLGALLVSAAVSALGGRPPREAVTRVVTLATRGPILALLVLMAAGGVGARLFLGYVSPGTYAEEVLGAKAFLAERSLYNGDDRDELRQWLAAEPMPADPFAIPGVSPCQASGMTTRPQFYTSQGHPPMLLLASAPIVAAYGGRGVFVAMSVVAIAAMAAAVLALAGWAGVAPRSPQTWLIAASLLGWQPVIAGLRQGDAAVLAGALVVLAWQLGARTMLAGLATGVATSIAPPAAAALAALVSLRRAAAFVAGCVVAVSALAAVAAGGLLVFADYTRVALAAARAYADTPVNYAVAGRLIASSPTLAPVTVAAIALAVVTGWRARSADAAFGAWLALGMLAAPIVWSQHLALTLVPIAVLLSRVVHSRSSWPLVAWTLLTIVLSLPDPAMSYLRDAVALVGPRAADVPVASVALLTMWGWLVATS